MKSLFAGVWSGVGTEGVELFLCKFTCIFFILTFRVFLQAKKRQIQLDTTYGSSMRELELLLDNFQIEKPEEHRRQGEPLCMLK